MKYTKFSGGIAEVILALSALVAAAALQPSGAAAQTCPQPAMDEKYAQLDEGLKQLFGKETENGAARDGGCYRHYENGSIYWSPQSDAHEVHGDIRAKWASLGWEWGLGYPLTDETTTPNSSGRYNHFQGGSIYWSPETGAHEAHGLIREKWASLDWEQGFLGYPITDETTTPDGSGRYNHFQGGSIYWTPDTRAHEVHGAIRDRWAGLGWETGFGYPTSDEIGIERCGGRLNLFQRGAIYSTVHTSSTVAVSGDSWGDSGLRTTREELQGLLPTDEICPCVGADESTRAVCGREAEPVTIDFDDLPAGGPGTAATVRLGAQYIDKGVVFEPSAVALDYSLGVAIPGFAHSGAKAIETCYASEFCTSPIEMRFTPKVTRVAIWAGYESGFPAGTGPSRLEMLLRTLDADGAEVGRATAVLSPEGNAPIRTRLEVSSTGSPIARALVSFGPETLYQNGLAVDDVEFEAAPEPIHVGRDSTAGRGYPPEPPQPPSKQPEEVGGNATSGVPMMEQSLSAGGQRTVETTIAEPALLVAQSNWTGTSGPVTLDVSRAEIVTNEMTSVPPDGGVAVLRALVRDRGPITVTLRNGSLNTIDANLAVQTFPLASLR
jgi:hypothetical protein